LPSETKLIGPLESNRSIWFQRFLAENNSFIYDLELSWRLSVIKFSRATSRVRWLKGEKNNVSRTISVLVLRVLSTTAGSPRELYYNSFILGSQCNKNCLQRHTVKHKYRNTKALFTRNYSKETERLRESPKSSLGDSAYVIQWCFSDGATGGDGTPPVAPSEKRH
jgi:hypothetical protein